MSEQQMDPQSEPEVEVVSSLSELDRRIERINILNAVMKTDMIPMDLGANMDVIAELNVKVRAFFESMLLSEFGTVMTANGPQHPLLAMDWTPERVDALKLLLDRVVNRQGAPAVAASASGAPAPKEPPPAEFESIHVMPLQAGEASARPSRRGGLITQILKGENPNLIVPTDPEFRNAPPDQRREFQEIFNQAVRDAEAKAKARTGG